MKKFSIFSVLLILTVVFSSCKDELSGTKNNPMLAPQSENNWDNVFVHKLDRDFEPIILGKKLDNPYSVANMRNSLNTLLAAGEEELLGCVSNPDILKTINIYCTDLYVRFLPQDTAQYNILTADTNSIFFDYPLDYEFEQDGDYYWAEDCNGLHYTWQYTKVPVDFSFPSEITYQILDSLFLYESDVKILIDEDKVDALQTIEAVSSFMTGNEFGAVPLPSKQKILKKVEKHFLWWKWDAWEYFPTGRLTVDSYHELQFTKILGNTPAQQSLPIIDSFKSYANLTEVPLKGVQVMIQSWFKWERCYTNYNGEYASSKYFLCYPRYYIYFYGTCSSIKWKLERFIVNWVQKYRLARAHPNGYSAHITTTTDRFIYTKPWAACITNNAFFEFMLAERADSLVLPPNYLEVALSERCGAYSTPMFSDMHMGVGDAIGMLLSNWTGAYWQGSVPYSLLFDLFISGGNVEKYDDNSGFYSYYLSIWHELSHSSHYNTIKTYYGAIAAYPYWQGLVTTEAYHSQTYYGIKGNNNWQQIAIAEGWATYREWNMGKKFLKWDTFKGILWNSYAIYNQPSKNPVDKFEITTSITDSVVNTEFPDYFSAMYYELEQAGCSVKNMQKSLNAKTLEILGANLRGFHPSLSNQINEIIEKYE